MKWGGFWRRRQATSGTPERGMPSLGVVFGQDDILAKPYSENVQPGVMRQAMDGPVVSIGPNPDFSLLKGIEVNSKSGSKVLYLTGGRLICRVWTSPFPNPQKRRPSTRGCQTNDVEGETSTKVCRGFQSNVENTVIEPSSHPQARTFPPGENSKTETESFSPAMVVSCSYWCVNMRGGGQPFEQFVKPRAVFFESNRVRGHDQAFKC